MDFYEYKRRFFENHEIMNIETTPMQNNSYRKEYVAADGAVMFEFNSMIKTEEETLLKTECYTTENATIETFYEEW